METVDIIKIGTSILTSLGGASLIILAFSSWLGKIWANRILEAEKNKFSAELEIIKTSNQNFVNAISVSNTLYIESQKAFAAEKISAMKLLWDKTIKIRKNRPSPISFLDILRFQEYGQIHANPKFSFFDEQLSIENLNKALNYDAEELRPFIDEKAYAYFWSYRALTGRISYYIKRIRDEGIPKIPWQEDKGVIEVLKPIFDDSELQKLKNEKWGTRILFEYIESSLAHHLRSIASGSELSRNSLEHSIAISNAAEALKKIEQSENKKLTSRSI